MRLSEKLARLAAHRRFQNAVLAVICLAALLVGVETYPSAVERHGPLLRALDLLILGLFTAELVVRIGAHGARPWRFFGDGWNVFDFVVVAVCFLPIHAEFAAVLRLVRVLRVLRLVSALPRLQMLVGALFKSVPSMGYVVLLLSLHFYIYAVVGTSFFGRNDPANFGSMHQSMLTLFQVVTLEGWVDILKTQMLGSAHAPGEGAPAAAASHGQPVVAVVYFISFILFGTMILLNLLIGVVVNALQEIAQETEEARLEGLAAKEQLIDFKRVASELRLLAARVEAAEGKVSGWAGAGEPGKEVAARAHPA